MLVGEQVAEHGTAGCLVGLDADEARERGTGGDAVLGQHPLDLPVARPVALVPDLLPHRHLARAVGGHGEGLESAEIDLLCAVGVQQLGCGVAQAQPLLDQAFRGAETGSDVGDGGAGQRQRAEGLDLVGGVHGDTDDVLGERELVVGSAVVDDAAGYGYVGGHDVLAGEVGERAESPAAGDDGIAVAAFVVGVDRTDDEVFQQPVCGDGCLELGEGGLAGRRLAGVGGRELQPVERDGSDDEFGHEGVSRNAWMGEGRHAPSGRALDPTEHSARPLWGERRGREGRRLVRAIAIKRSGVVVIGGGGGVVEQVAVGERRGLQLLC